MITETPLRHEFDAQLELHHTDNGVYFVVPFSVPDVYGTKGPLPVRGTIDGFPIRTTLVPFGEGEHGMVVRKEIRNAIDKSWSSVVHVVLERDTEERTVDVPDALAAALNKAGLRTKFDELAYTQRKEFAQWVERAKKEETRQRRVQEAVERIAAGRKLS